LMPSSAALAPGVLTGSMIYLSRSNVTFNRRTPNPQAVRAL
jgi:hypothetical protein